MDLRMSLIEKIDGFIARAETSVPQAIRRQKIILYANGIKSKLTQSRLALRQLTLLSNDTDLTTTSTDPEDFKISEKVGFYNDAYWAFLYSSLDVLGQIINQSLKLEMTEKDVSIKQVINKLNTPTYNT